MLRIINSAAANADLEGIWLYSFEQWGEAQADEYYNELIDGIEGLIDNPEIGKSQSSLRAGYRSFQINHHVVFYRHVGDVIRVVRVLHERMLPEKHL